MDIKVAILIDGSFFLKRLEHFRSRYFKSHPALSPEQTLRLINSHINKHLNAYKSNFQKNSVNYHLYRTYFYDAPPLSVKAHFPLKCAGESNRRIIDFAKSPVGSYRRNLLEQLKRQRKLALRLGELRHDKQWKLTDWALNQLLNGAKTFAELTNADFYYGTRQKGVDIKLGIDVATLSERKLVDKMVLIAGDSDFVPAAKLARTNGIDFVLDPLHNNIDPALHEHIDGLVSFDLVSQLAEVYKGQPDVEPKWWNGKNQSTGPS